MIITEPKMTRTTAETTTVERVTMKTRTMELKPLPPRFMILHTLTTTANIHTIQIVVSTYSPTWTYLQADLAGKDAQIAARGRREDRRHRDHLVDSLDAKDDGL